MTDLLRFAPKPYIKGLFPVQRRFVEDPAKRRAAVCGRRAGKTEGVASWLRQGCDLRPDVTNVYITLSQKNARRILWRTLRKANKRWEMGLTFNEQTLTATAPNGGRIWCTGCDNQAAAEDLRGEGYGRVAIDEAGSFPDWLEYLVEEVLDPALLDHDGELALVGSPGVNPIGYFYDRTAPDSPLRWATHHWTCVDNPHLNGAAYIERKKKENRWDDSHPTLRREYLGLWVRDDEALVYPFDPTKNVGTRPEGVEGRVRRVLSVDLGMDHPTAFLLATSIVGFPDLYIERAWRTYPKTIAHIAGQIDQCRHEYAKRGEVIDTIVVDHGGLGGLIISDLQNTYGIPCQPAEKKDKAASIHEFRGALLAGTVKIDPMRCQELREEWTLVTWNEDRDDHDERCLDDLCDDALYNRRAHGLIYRPEENPATPGTPAALLAEMSAHKKQRLREQQARAAKRSRWFGR